MKPLITTIIPTYQRPQTLKRAIKSVLNQTYTNFQVRVYDDASGDETAQVVAELMQKDARVNYYSHSKNIGPLANVNYGVQQIETPYYSILSDDDILLPSFYETAMAGFRDHPNAMFSGGTTIVTNEREVLQVYPRDKSGYYDTSESILEVLNGNCSNWDSIVFRKELIEREGALDVEIPAVDNDWLFRVAAHNPWIISENPCALFVVHPNSITSTADYRFFWPGWLKMIKKLSTDEKIPLATRLEVKEILTAQLKGALFELGYKAILKNDISSAYKSAELLRTNLDDRRRSALLYYGAKIGERSNLAYKIATVLPYKLLPLINGQARTQQKLTKQYGAYLDYIELYQRKD
jgi:glycosyltransferase involved in cell wall biosynthesis